MWNVSMQVSTVWCGSSSFILILWARFFRWKNPVSAILSCAVQSHSPAVRISCSLFGCKINVWAIARKQKEKSPNKNRNKSEAHKSKRKFAIIFCTFIKSSRCFMYTDQVNICFYRVGWLCWQLCQSLMLLSPGNLLLVKTSQWNSILIVT